MKQGVTIISCMCLVEAGSFAQSLERTPWIVSKTFLAGLHDLLYLVLLGSFGRVAGYFTMF